MGGIPVPCKKHAEREVGKQRQGLYDQPGVLFPYMLAHEKEHKLAWLHAYPPPGLREETLGIIGHKVGAVVHDLHLTLVAVLPYHVLDRGLGHPDEVGLLVEIDYRLYHKVGRRLGQDPLEIVAVLGVEGRDQRNLLKPRYPQGSMA